MVMGECSAYSSLQADAKVKFAALPTLTGQIADKPTHGQSSRGLDNSRTGQLANNEF